MDQEAPPSIPRRRLRELLAEAVGMCRDRGKRLWRVALVLLAVSVAIAYLSFLHELQPEGLPGGWLIKPVHALISIWAMVAGYRALLTDRRDLWRVDSSTLRFSGGTIVEFFLAIAAVIVVRLWTEAVLGAIGVAPPTIRTVKIVVVAIASILVSIAFLRAQPWLVGLAVDERKMTLQTSWYGSARMVAAMLGAWIPVLVPLMAAYAAVDAVADRASPVGAIHLPLAALSGTIETVIALATVIFNAALFRLLVRETEPVPVRRRPAALSEDR